MSDIRNENQIKDLRLSDEDCILEVGFNYYDRHLKNMDDVLCVTILNSSSVLEAMSFKQKDMVALRDHLNKMIKFKEKLDREVPNKQDTINLQGEVEALKTELKELKKVFEEVLPPSKKGFMVVDCGGFWNPNYLRKGMIYTEDQIREDCEFTVSTEWDGSLEDLNARMSREKEGGCFVEFRVAYCY